MASDRTSTTVEAYLDGLDPQRRPQAEAVRALIRDHLQPGFAEAMRFGMPTYEVPLDRFAGAKDGQPLPYVSFAVQKARDSLYLMCVDEGSTELDDLRTRWAGAKKLDMGKSCVRFKRIEDLDLPLLAEVIGSMSIDDVIDRHERLRQR